MIPAILRPHLAWWHDARENRLRPSAVGGVPIEDFRPSQPTCPEPGCGLTDPDAETVYVHAMETHYNRRKRAGRAVA